MFGLYLLSWDQINAALFAVGHLSAEVIQDKQLTPAALQQHHLVLHLWAHEYPVCSEHNATLTEIVSADA